MSTMEIISLMMEQQWNSRPSPGTATSSQEKKGIWKKSKQSYLEYCESKQQFGM